jgi:hypothetical protein
MRRIAIPFICLLAHMDAIADPLRLDALAPTYCDSEDVDDVYRDAKTGACLLGYSKELESAVVSINGKIVRLNVTRHKITRPGKNPRILSLGTREITGYVSSTRPSLKVSLDVAVVDSSCTLENESCCGDDYLGRLEVSDGRRRMVKSVRSSSGG